jgi:hypothetical protein
MGSAVVMAPIAGTTPVAIGARTTAAAGGTMLRVATAAPTFTTRSSVAHAVPLSRLTVGAELPAAVYRVDFPFGAVCMH